MFASKVDYLVLFTFFSLKDIDLSFSVVANGVFAISFHISKFKLLTSKAKTPFNQRRGATLKLTLRYYTSKWSNNI